ncbi:PadR family transcriptional regulator [Afifella pfennigii]|uniref:PadR family transcriptional regulator n=1 Tax=Afifella pfennigii TaxID=209897 RepID=UPI00068DEBE9|nr:PadR family transcriptional regulator [Afifella pfennigii]
MEHDDAGWADAGLCSGKGGGRGRGCGGGRGRGRGWRRSGRIFDHGELRLVVLALIAERPRHGYEIIKEIEERLAGSYSPSPGVIYPNLSLLEELGQARVEEDGGKKLYFVTEEGKAWLQERRHAVEAVFSRMRQVHANHGGGPAPEIVRAMENLKLALRLRQAHGPLSDEEVRRLAEILDGAALAVERG